MRDSDAKQIKWVSDIYKIYGTRGTNEGKLIGYMRLCGCEPLYLPVDLCTSKLGPESQMIGWMHVETWRGWVGRLLSDLRVERMT